MWKPCHISSYIQCYRKEIKFSFPCYQYFCFYPGSEGLGLVLGFLFFFLLVQSQIALWSLERMRHLCMHTAHGISRSCRREKLAWIPWFPWRWNHIQTNTPFAVDQHLRSLSVFGTGRSARLMRDQFWVNLPRTVKNHVNTKVAINRGYQLFDSIWSSEASSYF